MGIKRETYVRRFKQLFNEVVNFVDQVVADRKVEISKTQISPDRFIYTLNWQGRPINAFMLELLYCNGYPYINIHYDGCSHTIVQLHRKAEKKESEMAQIEYMIDDFIEETILSEAKKVALEKGLFAEIKNRVLVIPFGDRNLLLRYSVEYKGWEVECENLWSSWVLHKCGDLHPLEFLSHLLRALALQYLL
jgi:hypothetical protein